MAGNETISYGEAMHMNRHQRRALRAINKVPDKIPGVTMPIINKARQMKKAKAEVQRRLNENL